MLRRVPRDAALVSLEFSLVSDYEVQISSGGWAHISLLNSNDQVFNLVSQVLGAYGGSVRESAPGIMILKLIDQPASKGVFAFSVVRAEIGI